MPFAFNLFYLQKMESEKKTSLTKGHNEHFAVFLLHKKLM